MGNDVLLAKWLAGELSDAELRDLENSPEFASYVRISNAVSRMQPPAFDEEKSYLTLLEKRRQPRVLPLFARTWFRVAATLVVLLGIATFFVLNSTTKLVTANGELANTTLPDDTQVAVNAVSDLQYNAALWSLRREVRLRGEAYFNVTKGRKFTVETPEGKVEVIGTRFTVKSHDDRLRVFCHEGKVRVSNGSHSITLSPGEGLVLDGKQIQRRTNKTEYKPSWLLNRLHFENDPINLLLAEIERQYGVAITLKAQRTKKFTGTLPRQNINEALQVITDIYGLKAITQGKKIVLLEADARQ